MVPLGSPLVDPVGDAAGTQAGGNAPGLLRALPAAPSVRQEHKPLAQSLQVFMVLGQAEYHPSSISPSTNFDNS